MPVRLSYVLSNMRNEMKCLSVSLIRSFQYGKWNVCPSVIRGFQYEEWNEMVSVHLSHTWFPIWGMKWNVVCPSQSYVVSNMRNEMKCCLSVSVIRGFQYEEWNEMLSVRLSCIVSNMRNEMKCLSVCHTWFPIWGMKWNVVCPSVIRGFQYEEWNEMLSVRLSYVVSNMRNEMKCCLSVCHTWFPIWDMKWNVCLSQLYLFSNMRNEMECLSVCHTWFPIWWMKWNVVCPSVIRGLQYEEWNQMLSVRLSHTWFPIWGMKCNVVCPSQSYMVSNMRNKMKCCLSVCHTWFPIWGMKWNVVRPSVIRSFQYEEWNEMPVRLSYVVWNMRNEMKCCLSVSLIRSFQYGEWNEMSVRLSYVVSNMRNEMKWFLSISVIRGFQYEEWNEMLSVRLSHTWFPIWGMKWNVVCPSQSYVVSNIRNEMKCCLSVCHT